MKLKEYAKVLLLSSLSFSAYASKTPDPNLSKLAYPPHHLKSNVATIAPSGYSPAQIRNAYGLTLLAQQGAGQTIGIVDAFDNPNAEADLGVFSSQFGLPQCTTGNGCFKKIYASGTQPPGNIGWGLEIALDIQWAHAAAPLAKIILVEAADNSINSLLTAINVAVKNGANVISLSWGAGEFSTESQYDSYFNVSNVSFTAASGDGGAGIIWPSVSPYVIAVGGTSLQVDSAGNYISETAWAGSGGGLSAYVGIPSYQTNFANQYNPNNKRGIPDVSMVADPNTGLSVYDSYGYGGWLVVGGTSASSPLWAGVIAVTNSSSSSSLPALNAALYAAAASSYTSDYHDITVGSNGSCGPVCEARPGYDYVTGLGSPISQNLVATITKGCVHSNPTVVYTPNTTQTIPKGGTAQVQFTVTNNDSAACQTSTFKVSSSVDSSAIKATLSTNSLAIPAGGTGSGVLSIKASKHAHIGSTYTASVKIADTSAARSISFASSVLIGR